YSRRVPANLAGGGAAELAELSHQFNVMAARLGESMEIIRRDRDRSRDFPADVSHELRTPIAALRTFNELLRESAAADPDARAERRSGHGPRSPRSERCPDRRQRYGRRDRRDRAAPDLRSFLPRLERQRGPQQWERARAGDREVDRRHAQRPGECREPRRKRS